MGQFSKKLSNDKAKKRKARRLELESKVKEFQEQLTTASNNQLINDYNKCKEEFESLYDYITDVIYCAHLPPDLRKARNQGFFLAVLKRYAVG